MYYATGTEFDVFIKELMWFSCCLFLVFLTWTHFIGDLAKCYCEEVRMWTLSRPSHSLVICPLMCDCPPQVWRCHLNYWLSRPEPAGWGAEVRPFITPGWIWAQYPHLAPVYHNILKTIYKLSIQNMAAAQVAKKLKDRRQKHTLEEIFRKVGLC